MRETIKKEIDVPLYTNQGEILHFDHEGHHTLHSAKGGSDGHLKVKVRVKNDPTLRREGLNIISKHYLTLTQALLGSTIEVNTCKGTENIEMKEGFSLENPKFVFHGKGVENLNGIGDHIAEIHVVVP